MRLDSRTVFGVLLMIVGTLFVAFVAVRFLLPPSGAVLPSVGKVSTEQPPQARSSPSLPSCPPAGLAPLRSSAQTGHHKVVLSWNASAPSPNPDGKVVGYCLYRSKKQNSAKQNPICRDCEQINPTPVVGTGCVDDLVLDTTAYYYVVTAVNAKGTISPASNETLAKIPPATQSVKPAAASSYPFCRGSASAK